MTVTPHDFYRMTSHRCDGALINFKGESGVQLGIELFERWYSSNTIYYFDIKLDYRVLS